MHDIEELRGGSSICVGKCKIATWNIEGLTEEKLVELIRIMEERDIGILCLQETHCAGADYFLRNDGYLVIQSGGPNAMREWAGVGFLVAPAFRRSVLGFNQFSDRIASLKLKVLGGQMTILTAYAPHSGHDYAIRRSFFDVLMDFMRCLKCYGPNIFRRL